MEFEIAVEPFGLIAEQSRCSTYIVAWVDPLTQQVASRCAKTLLKVDRAVDLIAAKMRFVIDVPKSLAEFR